MMQSANGAVPPPSVPITQQQQQQQMYHQQPPPPHQWMMPPPQQQPQGFPSQLPPAAWPQQAPMQMPPQPQFYQAAAAEGTEMSEIKSLWIGGLQYWMDEAYLQSCFGQTGELVSAKVIRNKQTGQIEGYGFLEFTTHAAAERVLLGYNGTLMPNGVQNFRLNWATLGAGMKRVDDGPDYTIFVGDLAADVTDYLLQETFKAHYPSVKGANVVTDRMTGRPKGYGFVRFGDESEQLRAMTEMNGALCSTRAMRIGPAANKKPVVGQQTMRATSQSSLANPGESDPNNTTIFVGGLDESVSDELLRHIFCQFGELVHLKIVPGKRCGFVQFVDRASAEQALSMLSGTQIGGLNVRLSWGHSPNKQARVDQAQYGGSYYGYMTQGYDAHGGGYAPPQDPSMYYGASAGYGGYHHQQQQQ